MWVIGGPLETIFVNRKFQNSRQKGVVSYGFWGMIPVAFRLCMSEPYDTRWANQVVPYGPYGPPEVLIFAQKNPGKFKFLIFWVQKCPFLGPY